MIKRICIAVLLLLPIADSIAQTKTYMDMGDSVKTWIQERVDNAKKGIKEKVQMPFVVHSTGWGCQCPAHYIGVSTTTQDGPWVAPVVPKKFPVMNETGHSLEVVGYFTGKMITEDLRNENGEPEEWLYVMPEFKILSWKVNNKDYDVEAPRVIGTYKK